MLGGLFGKGKDKDKPSNDQIVEYVKFLKFFPAYTVDGSLRETISNDELVYKRGVAAKIFSNIKDKKNTDEVYNEINNFYDMVKNDVDKYQEYKKIINELEEENISDEEKRVRIASIFQGKKETIERGEDMIIPPKVDRNREDVPQDPLDDRKDTKYDFKDNLSKKELKDRIYYSKLLKRGIAQRPGPEEIVDLTVTDPQKKIEFVGYDDGYSDILTEKARQRMSRMTPDQQYALKKKVLLDKYLKPELKKDVSDVDVAAMLAGDEKGLDLYQKYVLLKKREDARRRRTDPFYRTDYVQPYLTEAKIKKAKQLESWKKANIENKLYKTLLERPDHQALDSFEQVLTFLVKTAKDDLLYLNKITAGEADINKPDDKIRAKIKEQVLREKLDTYIRFVDDTNFSDIKHITNPIMLYKFAVTKKMLPVIYQALSAKINAKYQYDIIQANYKKLMDGVYFKPNLYLALYKVITHLFKDIESRIVIVSRIIREVEQVLKS